MLTSLIDGGQGSANSYGMSGTGGKWVAAAGPFFPDGFGGSSPKGSPTFLNRSKLILDSKSGAKFDSANWLSRDSLDAQKRDDKI